MKTYSACVDWLFEQLPMFQRVGEAAYKKDLTRTRLWCAHLGNPQENKQFVHVAGTNGKGSTCHMLASVLQEAGYKVGLLTSPHLVDFRERIRVNGVPIEKIYVQRFVQDHQAYIEQLEASFFEITTGMAFAYFQEKEVDIAIIETGLGGELDSTNIIQPIACGITNIGWDHMHILGNSLQEIARAKAGIIKPETPVVLGELEPELHPIFVAKAEENRAPLFFSDDLVEFPFPLDLKGIYQQANARLALQILEVIHTYFPTSEKSREKGFAKVVENTGLQGRWQKLGESPLIIADTAHNANGLQRIQEQMNATTYEQLHLVLGFVRDKNPQELVAYFPQDAQFYFSEPQVPRKLPITEVRNQLGLRENYGFYPSLQAALAAAKENAGAKDFIYIGGSTFVVAELLQA